MTLANAQSRPHRRRPLAPRLRFPSETGNMALTPESLDGAGDSPVLPQDTADMPAPPAADTDLESREVRE